MPQSLTHLFTSLFFKTESCFIFGEVRLTDRYKSRLNGFYIMLYAFVFGVYIDFEAQIYWKVLSQKAHMLTNKFRFSYLIAIQVSKAT